MAIVLQKAVKHILLSCQAEISGKTYEVLTTFYAKQSQFQNRSQSTEVRRQMTEDSKISAKSTPKLRFSVPTNFFYNCSESSTNRPYFLQNKANFRKAQMNVNSFITTDYENISNWTLGENKPKQTQFARG